MIPSMPERSVSLVTGSSRGIGLAIAEALAERGDLVHVVHRSEPAPESLVETFGERVHQADLTCGAEAARVVAEILQQDGSLSNVVHAVGDYGAGPLEDTSPETLEQLFRSNVTTAFHLVHGVRSALRSAGNGRLVFLGTAGLAGHRARSRSAAYAAAKSALFVLVRSWAKEEASHGVTVNMVSPGLVPHPDAHADTLDPERLASIPAGRPSTPAEIASACAFLCSDQASHATGGDLQVGGGFLL